MRVLSPIHQANRQASLYLDRSLADLGISAQEGQLLAFVAARDGVPVKAIARLLGVVNSTLTTILRRLEGKGLLLRSENPSDARSSLLLATEEGRRIGELARARVLQLERRVQAHLSDADLAALLRIVAAVTVETGIDLPAESPRRRDG